MSEAYTMRDSELAIAFGDAVVRCRGGRSAAGVAEAVGISSSLLSSIECGSLTSLKISLRLWQELGFSLDSTFGVAGSSHFSTIAQAVAAVEVKSASAISRLTGVSVNAAMNALKGRRLKMATVIKLARALGFSLDALDWRLCDE